MDPVEVREQRVDAGAPVTPVTPVAAGTAYGTYSTRTVYPVAYRAIQLVWFVVGVINVILALDFIFRLLKANDTGFVDFIYGLAGTLASPFDGIFGSTITRTSYTARWADIVGIAIYSLIGFGIAKLIRISTARSAAGPPAV